jgi:hypothetical protein
MPPQEPQENMPMMTATEEPKRPVSLTLGQYTPNTTRGDVVRIPPKLADEAAVMMKFPYKVSFNLDDYDGLVSFPAGTHPVPMSVSDHPHLKKNHVTKYQKTAVDTLGLTDHHIAFLQSRGFRINSIAAAVTYVKNLDPRDRAAFFAEAQDWKSPQLQSQDQKRDEDEAPKSTEEELKIEGVAESKEAKGAANRKGQRN